MDFLPSLSNVGAYAFFLDFDGTLTEIADTPAAVAVDPRTPAALARLHGSTGGALAIVTGREIDTIDRFLAPLRLPVAGVHGYELRDVRGFRLTEASDDAAGARIEGVLANFAAQNPGLLLERKRGALAIHYRLRPELETLCLALVKELTANLSGFVLTHGKMVVELRLHRATKGTAIALLMQQPPFQGRVPFFAGDDATDEDAILVVNALGGITAKVGPGESAAQYRVPDVSSFLSWLYATAGTFEGR
ncbi:trehalose-phosphatase [Rhodomicrobium vannielii ATCC 17100]|uniref:trehalose-phosphatase n=1 Tax=Rhodomicrobium vannielii TaxID=1069 RepID=UPI0019184B94|nr:trehalose-phosphatase [Rhodomicrobium vannielii]MBJ7533412.1 trehalose-phosphatase [Rhodomicrobium vannielii ATCC 17100]